MAHVVRARLSRTRSACRCAARPRNRNAQSDGIYGIEAQPSRRSVCQIAGACVAFLVATPPSLADTSEFRVSEKSWTSFLGPADLIFPATFEGTWTVRSTLEQVELPLGEDFVEDLKSVRRAQAQDLQRTIGYDVAFTRNKSGAIVLDRKYNTAALLSTYYGGQANVSQLLERVQWDSSVPNDLNLKLPSGGTVQTRVTRRSEDTPASNRIETSEYFRQTFASQDGASSRIKASQCFTKYKWRSREEAKGGPEIIATQIITDYLTPYDDQNAYLKSMGRPVTKFTYKMSFFRTAPSSPF